MGTEKSDQSVTVQTVENVVIRFAGDSGDGMQLTGDQFTTTSAILGEAVATLPDYPSEIRAPAGTLAGVSGFQLHFGCQVFTPGDLTDVLVAMNPAALRVNLPLLKEGGLIIVNEDAFFESNLKKAGYAEHPLKSSELARWRVYRVGLSSLTQNALEGHPLSVKQVERSKNFTALGITYWLFNRPMESTISWIQSKFPDKPEIVNANIAALKAGWNYADTTEFFNTSYVIKKPEKNIAPAPGIYRHITGNSAAALGLMAAAKKAGLKLFLGSYPITPATEIMQELSLRPDFATVFQAEDEIAGIGSALGAAFGGALAATSTSGPGLSLKSEFIGLAMITELPLVIIDVQRGGPSTGLPTKTEQSDLMQALWGRHGECPLPVLAARTPHDCFEVTYEAARIALKYMTPVIVLSDGYLGHGADAWRVPGLSELPEIEVRFASPKDFAGTFTPYSRDPKTLARPWAVPGTAGLEHRIGGLEKEDITGNTSHDPLNHEKMVMLRAQKVNAVAQEFAPLEVDGPIDAEVLVLSWGSTYGVISQAVRELQSQNHSVAALNLRLLNPFPIDLKKIVNRHKKILVPEMNSGHLRMRLRSEFLVDAQALNKIQGRPFQTEEIKQAVLDLLRARV